MLNFGVGASLQVLVLTALGIVVFIVQAMSLIDAARRPARAFTAEGKLTKQIWLIILVIAATLGFLGLPPLYFTASSFLNVFAVVPAVVYWVDVRPRVKPYGPNRGSGGGRGSGGRPGGW